MDDKITDGEQRDEVTVKNPAMQFLLERVVVWLAEKGRRDTEHVVELVFSSLYCCSQQETIRILNHITMVTWNADVITYDLMLIHIFLMQRDDLLCRRLRLYLFVLFSLVSRWSYSGELSCKLYRGYVCHMFTEIIVCYLPINHIYIVINICAAICPVRHVQILRL